MSFSERKPHLDRARKILVPMIEELISTPTRSLVKQVTIRQWNGNFAEIAQIYVQAHIVDISQQTDIIEIVNHLNGNPHNFLANTKHPLLNYDLRNSAYTNHFFWFIGNNAYPPEKSPLTICLNAKISSKTLWPLSKPS